MAMAEPEPLGPIPVEELEDVKVFKLKNLDERTRKLLAQFDVNGDGELSIEEISEVVNKLVETKYKARLQRIIVITLVVTVAILLGACFGLTWAVAISLKDTKVHGSTLVDKNTGMIIRTASADVAVANGSLAVRDSNGTVPVTTQKYAKDVLVTGAMALQDIMNMKTIYIANNATKAQLSLSLWGAVRESSTSSRITLVTSGGTAVLDGLHIVEPDTNFTATVEAAGFVFTSIASTGRRLLQANATNITLVGSCLNCPGATELNSGPILGSVDPATLECAPRQDWYLYMPSTPELCSDRAAACGVSLADFLAQDKKKNKCCVKHSGDSSGDRYITACAVCIPRDCQV